MALNIKNERVHALAREAAQRTGMSQTAVIENALVRLLAELPRDSAEEARRRRALDWFHSLPPVSEEDRQAVWAAMDEMYDEETGLPR